MKKLVLVIALGAIGFGAKAQLKIGNSGNIWYRNKSFHF